MATLFVRHMVADYSTWRKGFDDFHGIAREHSIKSAAVYQTAGNPKEVTVIHDFETISSRSRLYGASRFEDGDGESRRAGLAADVDH